LVNQYVTDQEAAGYFRRADVVALPYLRSSASGKLAIAQTCGLPAVVTESRRAGGATADYTGAILLQPDSPDDLARGLLAAADLRGRRHSAPVTWQAVAESYADIFAAVAPPAEPAPVTTGLKPGRLPITANRPPVPVATDELADRPDPQGHTGALRQVGAGDQRPDELRDLSPVSRPVGVDHGDDTRTRHGGR
jgi:hypothetical protein